MFEATLLQGAFIRQLFDALKELVTEINIECTSSGMKAQAMEPSHVSLAAIQISTDAFESYRCDRNQVIGLNITSVSKILKCLESHDTLSINTADKSDTVTFCISSKKMDKISNFELKLININPDTLTISENDYEAEFTLPSSKFSQICRDLSNFGDTVDICVRKHGVDFISEGNMGSAKITIKSTDSDPDDKESGEVSIDCSEPVSQTFSLKFLNIFTKSQALCKSQTLFISKSYPLCVECKLNDGSWGHVRYYLAPKLKDDQPE